MTATTNGHPPYVETDRQRRDVLLSGVAEAARRLLAIADFDEAVNGALEAIATATGIDRIYILENYIDPRTGEELGVLPYEWTAQDVIKAQNTPDRFPMSYADFGDWLGRWKAGESIQALAQDLSAPARELQKKDEALSLLTVPIRLNGKLWGVIGFDDCTSERVWSKAEIAVLETAAANFSGALQRRDSERERHRRDALLSGVAEAARRLLAIADFDAAVNGALEAIATATGIDRIFIYQHHADAQTQREFATCPYEWTIPGLCKMRDVPNQFPEFYDEIEGWNEWLIQLQAGSAVQKLAKEMSEAGQQKQKRENALSVLTVPIFVGDTYWGNFGFDDCTTERVWSEAEIAVLETAAASFAGALQRRGDLAELEQRDALLNSVNAAAQCLVATEDLERAIPEALRILGEGTQQDRAYVFENVFPKGPDEVFWDMSYEWSAPEVASSTEYGMHLPVPMGAFPPQLNVPLLEGRASRCLVRDLDGIALDLNKEAQALSLVAVPITVEGRWWGLLGFDDCKTERLWSDAEVAVLETAAACIGSAIERDRTRKEHEATARARTAELEAHNQVLAGRDRILTATAEASKILQTTEDNFDRAVNTAIRILGESIGCDRAFVAQQIDDPTGESLGFLRLLYEWTHPVSVRKLTITRGCKISLGRSGELRSGSIAM